MAVPRRLPLDTLEDLSPDDFETFKCELENGVLDSCIPFPGSGLEKANQSVTVDVMKRCTGEEMAVNVTVKKMKEMVNSDAAEKLKKKYTAGNTAAASTSAAAPPAAAAAPPAVTMMAQTEGVVIAPTVTGGTLVTLNINFSNP